MGWRTRKANEVELCGFGTFEPDGAAKVMPEHTGCMHLIARNRFGVVEAVTPLIRIVPLPTLEFVPLPQLRSVYVTTDVTVPPALHVRMSSSSHLPRAVLRALIEPVYVPLLSLTSGADLLAGHHWYWRRGNRESAVTDPPPRRPFNMPRLLRARFPRP